MLRRISLAILITSFTLCAQRDGVGSIGIVRSPVAPFAELKEHLGLSDDQLERLLGILREKSEANREIYRQIEQKQAELRNLLENGSRDVNRIGQLTLDIHTLNKQVPASGDTWRQRALGVLTPEQRTKLAVLDQALKLATPAYQAITLDLIDGPPALPITLPTDPRGIPTPPIRTTPVPLPQPIP